MWTVYFKTGAVQRARERWRVSGLDENNLFGNVETVFLFKYPTKRWESPFSFEGLQTRAVDYTKVPASPNT